ncbi:alpha-galactosidase [Streptomyces sp. NPDC056255]|uniref:alpha-galactosidase n=1 Tax=Streptomyces sp. NPDC056255 TaxID=3345764 RepID=UPI0035DCC911
MALHQPPHRRRQLRLLLTDRHYPLTAELCYRVRPGSDVIERWTELTHTGTENAGPITVDRLDSASWTAPPLPDYRLSHLIGGWNSEFQLHRDRLPVAETVLTSHHANPWLALDDGTADEDDCEVWSTALAWSGSWRITVHRDPAGRTTWTGGFGHEGVGWTLGPGETLRTPVFAGLYTDGGLGAASRAWHTYLRAHVLPSPDRDRPVLYNSWEATDFGVDHPGQLHLARLATRLGAELFVVDDGWFGARTSDRAGLGDWTPRPSAFPDGLRPLADEVHRLGRDFGLWVEPEMVNRDSDLYRAPGGPSRGRGRAVTLVIVRAARRRSTRPPGSRATGRRRGGRDRGPGASWPWPAVVGPVVGLRRPVVGPVIGAVLPA